MELRFAQSQLNRGQQDFVLRGMRRSSFFSSTPFCISMRSHCLSYGSTRFVSSLLPSLATNASSTFHKRPLPESLISLSSKNGKEIFREALATGGMESYFALAEQFVTQSEPAYCSLSSLAMVLNALNFDPKKVWKGVWRWVSEETLQCDTQVCGHTLEKVRRDGMDFNEFESLARCHGIRIRAQRNDAKNHSEACDHNLSQFRSYVSAISSSDKSESFIVANFSRKVLGQTGDGHFSPIGGYHKGRDLVLIMDVARFKYPPFWVPLEMLWASMAVDDETTKSPRGYFILSTWTCVAAADLHSALITPIDRNKNEDPVTSNSSNHEDRQSEQHRHNNLILDCPPLIRTWKESRRLSANLSDTCSVCNTTRT